MSELQAMWGRAQELMAEGKLAEAEMLLAELVEAKPHELNMRAALANVYSHQGHYAEAIGVLLYSAAVDCRDIPTQMALAVAYDKLGDDAKALFHYERLQEIDAHCAASHWLRGFFLLKRGDRCREWWRRGWADYEWGRIGGGGVAGAVLGSARPMRSLKAPWDGRPIPGKRLYICHEQGHGDAIMFGRFLPVIKERSQATVILEAPQGLLRLFQGLEGVDVLVSQQAQGSFASAFDEYVSLMSVVHVLGLSLEDVKCGPYLALTPSHASSGGGGALTPGASTCSTWVVMSGDELRPDRALVVGLCWRGSRGHPGDAQRSMAWEAMAPLTEVAGCRFVSLLPGDETLGGPVLSGDFLNTARLVAKCDLVITVDTSIAHLAGAMGVPVWTLLAHDNDYRWFLEREDTPWYTSMRLFRQPSLGDWGSVVQRVKTELAELYSCR